MQATVLRRVSTHASTTTMSSRPAASIRTRHSTDSRLLEDVFNPGDELGPGLSLFGQPITVVHAREQCVPTMRILQKLGTGSYAVVYLAEEIVPTNYADNFLNIQEEDADGESLPNSPKPAAARRRFAVKCLAKHAQDQEAQLLEASIHQSLPVHPNVVTLHTTLETPSYLLLVLDYAPGEDLFYFLEQSRDHDEYVPGSSSSTSLPPSLVASLPSSSQLLSYHRLRLIASMFSQMCDAVAHCHRHGVFHRDIKPENFMVTDSHVFNPATGQHERKVIVKLTDFGLATCDAESGDMDCGSAPYMSFECHNNFTPTYATAPADVWSLGIVLINMLYHANPWLTTAIGQCQSFEFFLTEPIRFFMDRFPGMTPAVAEFFARRVFCLLDPSNSSADIATPLPAHYPIGHRITAEQFGVWARDLPLHLGPSARRTPAIAFQQNPTPSPAPRPRSPTDSSRLMPSVSQPGTRTPSPSYHTRPPPTHADATNPAVIIDSDDEDELDNERTRTTSSKRRKRGFRGKSQLTSQSSTAPANGNLSGLTSAALYAESIRNNASVPATVDDQRLNDLAEKSQLVAREASAIRHMKMSPQTPTQQNLPVTVVTVTPATPASSAVNTARSTPELRPKRSMKWTDIFKRDSASDQEVPTAAEMDAIDNGRDSFSSPAEIKQIPTASKPTPTATAKHISNLIMSLDSTAPPVNSGRDAPVSVDDLDSWRNGASPSVRSSSLSSRGRRKDRRNGGTERENQRAASPSSLVSNSTGGTVGRGRSAPSGDRRARSKSPTQAVLAHLGILPSAAISSTPEAFNDVAPPVPTVPEVYRSAVPVPVHLVQETSQHGEIVLPPQQPAGNRRSYAPSIASVSTATTSSSGFTAFSGKYKRSSTSSRYSGSGASVRSVSTNATSVSSGSGSWRVANGKKGPPPPLPATNVKAMDGIPWELDALPRQMHHKPKEHVIASEPKKKNNNNRRRPPSAPTSPSPGSSFGLDTISERPKMPTKSALKNTWTPASMLVDPLRSDDGYMGGMGEMGTDAKSFGARRPRTSGGLSIDTTAANNYDAAASTSELVGGAAVTQNFDSVPAATGAPVPAGKPKTPKWGFMKSWRK